MSVTRIQFDINSVEASFLTELLEKIGAVNIQTEEQKLVEIPEEHLESINIGLSQMEQGLFVSSEEVRNKARAICLG